VSANEFKLHLLPDGTGARCSGGTPRDRDASGEAADGQEARSPAVTGQVNIGPGASPDGSGPGSPRPPRPSSGSGWSPGCSWWSRRWREHRRPAAGSGADLSRPQGRRARRPGGGSRRPEP